MKIYLVWDDGDMYGPDAVTEGFVHMSRASALQRGLEHANKYQNNYTMSQWEDGSIGDFSPATKTWSLSYSLVVVAEYEVGP